MPETTFQNGLTLKSFFITLCLIPINIYFVVQLEVVRYTFPTLVHPLSNVIFILFWLILIGAILKKISPKLGISPPELLTIYVMLGVVSALCSADTMQILITILGHPFRFATPENQWRELFWKELPSWLTVQDEKALTAYYEGGSSFYIKRHLYAWLRPALAYIVFIFVLMFVMLCINTLLRIQWTERERLTYPIIQLPLEMTDTGNRFFKNKLMWLGFSIAALISIMNLLNSIYPAVPYIPVKRQNLHQYFTVRPWNAMGSFRVSFYPFVIGIGFLIPLDLLFSCWMFYGVYKIELMIGNIMGWRNLPRFPYFNEQALGVYVALLVFVLWIGRVHFKGLVRHLLGSSSLDDSREPMPYRLAVAGIVIGLIFLMVFSYRAGMSLWVTPIFFAIYFLVAIMIARLRAELGFLVHDLHYIDPHNTLVTVFGTRRLGSSTLTVFSLYQFFNRAYRAHPMPPQLEGLKIAERRNINPRHIAAAILIATFIGSVSVFWVLLDGYYRHGAETGYYGPWALGFGRAIYGQLETWLNYPRETDIPAIAFMGGGLSFAALLMFLRTRFLWWPLHPLGYAMANSWGMFNLWACLFVAWVAKAIILRHGGLRAYRQAIPFFLGLALGDYMFGSLWSIISIATNSTLYQFFP